MELRQFRPAILRRRRIPADPPADFLPRVMAVAEESNFLIDRKRVSLCGHPSALLA